MSKVILLSVPAELAHSFFFAENNEIEVEENEFAYMNLSKPFLYEAAYFSGVEAIQPWDNQEQSIPALMKEWQMVKDVLDALFSKREISLVLPHMKKGIGLLLEFVYWGNGVPVVLSNSIDTTKLSIKPVNISERLEFIMKRPSLYHSFIQLSELIGEMNKLYVKQHVMKKASKH